MKADVLTVAAIVFLVGTLVSGMGIMDVFETETTEPPSDIHQGVVLAEQKQGFKG